MSNNINLNMYQDKTLNRNVLRVASLNIRGQTGLNVSKQVQIENFLKVHDIDILHLQEIKIEDSS